MARITAASMLAAAIICAGCATSPNKVSQEASQQTTLTSKQATSGTAKPETKTGPQPEWVAGDINEYPRVQYITSRTQAKSMAEADRQAMANISKLYMVDIKQFDMSEKQALDASGYELNTTHQKASASTAAAPEISRVLESIEIVDRWHDSETDTYHSLAAMPRNTGKGFLQSQIESLDEKTREYMNQARSDPDPFVQAGRIAMAWRCQQLRSKLQDSMRIADLTGRGIAPEFDIRLLRQDVDNLLTTLQIEATALAENEDAQLMLAMLKGGLKVAGLEPTKENADYIIRGTLDTAIVGERDGWALGHGQLKLVLADKVTGELRGSTTWEVEVPGLDENHAIRRVYEKTEYMLKVKMRDVLMEMAMQ